MSLDEVEEWGLQYEKQQKLNGRWTAPPSADRMHIQYAAPKKQTTRKSAAAASVSGEVAAATWASAPQPPRQQQQRPQQQLPIPQQPAVVAKGKGRPRDGRWKAKNEGAPSEHGTPSASSRLPVMDITGQVEAAAAMREHATLRSGARREVHRDTCPLRAIPRCHRRPHSRCNSALRRSSRSSRSSRVPCYSSELHQRSRAPAR